MKKILHIVSNVGKQSGVMKVIMGYNHAMHKNYIFDFLCWDRSNSDDYSEEIRELGGKVYFIERPQIGKNSSWFEFFKDGYGKEYEIVHLHMCFIHSLVKKAIPRETKLICHAHTDKFSDKLTSAIRNRILCIGINKNADVGLACSVKAGKNYFGKEFRNENVLLNALNFDDYSFNIVKAKELKKQLGFLGQEKIFIHIGGFRKQKNHKFLIEIFSELVRIDPNSILLLVGKGPLERSVFELVKKKGLQDKVKFLGVRTDVPQLLGIADVCIFPSKFEGLGIVLIECQLSKIRTFCSDVVPVEAFVSKYITPLSLKSSPRIWAENITNNKISPTPFFLNNEYSIDDYNINRAKEKLSNIYDSFSTTTNS